MRKYLTSVSLYALAIFISAMSVVQGYGLEVQSWGWIYFGGVVAPWLVAWAVEETQ